LGRVGLHRLEAEVLVEELDRADPVVVNAAASVVDDPALRRRLSERAFVVWLHADPGVLADRVAAGNRRPALGAEPLLSAADIELLAAQRRDAFVEVADLAVDTTSAPPDQVARRIIEALAAPSTT
jgi:shikimate kinase